MKLKKCDKCKEYTMVNECKKCSSATSNAHYKFIKVRDAPKTHSR